MTMIEIMVVVALIGMVVVAGVSRLGGTGRKMKQAVRRFSVLGKDLHTKAKLLQRTYRIVISMNDEGEHTYWVESSEDNVKLISEEKKKELEKLTKLQREGLIKEYGFSMDPRVTKRPLTLPSPLKFKRVEFSKKSDPTNEGTTYIHFFPHGLVEEAAIYISDGEKLNWTIAFHPVTGKTDIFSKDIPLKELRNYED